MKQPKHISLKGFLAIQILHELRKNELCGDELAKIIGKRKGSKLTPGTIYPTLKFLRKNKLVKYNQNGRKKEYFLTKKGENEYKIARKYFLKLFKQLKDLIKTK